MTPPPISPERLRTIARWADRAATADPRAFTLLQPGKTLTELADWLEAQQKEADNAAK